MTDATASRGRRAGRRTDRESASVEQLPAAVREVPSGSYSLVPAEPEYEEDSLLDCARKQWQFGDWDGLCRLSASFLKSQPDRAKLALLVGCAWQQRGDHAAARRFVTLAKRWGCERKLLAQLLVAGVYNTLGRAAVLGGDEVSADAYFRASVSGVSGETNLAVRTRIARESESVTKQLALGSPSTALASAVAASPAKLTCDVTGGAAVVVVAGMRHSGSTALFNLIRLGLLELGIDLRGAYAEHTTYEQTMHTPFDGVRLIKAHESRDDLLQSASFIFTTVRDLRDSVASAVRRGFPMIKKIGNASEYARYNRSLHTAWAPFSGYEFVYERFMADPVSVTKDVFSCLGLEHANAERIVRAVQNLPQDDYANTLLSPTHITDPTRVLTYHDSLLESEIARIEAQNRTWLVNRGYLRD